MPWLHQSIITGEYDIPGNLFAILFIAISVREKGCEPSPQPVRLQTNSSEDASGTTGLRSNFLGNTASSNNICTTASQTLVCGSMIIHDQVIRGLHKNEKNKNNAMIVYTAKCIEFKELSFTSLLLFSFQCPCPFFLLKKKCGIAETVWLSG